MTVSGGNVSGSGGGILNTGSGLTLINTIVTGNSAETGGGVANQAGTLELINSIIRDNNAARGGGIYVNLSTAALTQTAIVSNSAVIDGGGLLVEDAGTVTLINSTISYNSAGQTGGGVFSESGGSVQLTNSTVSANSADQGGGLANYGGIALTNTIVANQLSGEDCGLDGPGSNGYNLASDASCYRFTATGDLTNTNPLLGPLADNGGDTPTHALLPGSPAIDAGDNSVCPATDQRGVLRPQGSGCDIGAYEASIILLAADLAISKAAPSTIVANSLLTYTLTVTNSGSDQATGVIVRDVLPGNVDFASASPGCSEDNDIVYCSFDVISVGNTINITIAITNISTGTITNTATVTGNEPDPDLANNTAVAVTTVGSDSSICNSVTGIPLVECQALEVFYNSTNGPAWLNNTNWLATNTPCSWYGVLCSAGRVTSLNLSFNQLSGPIPPELGNLTGLEYLSLGGNDLSGPIPPQLGNLTSLTYLNLLHNGLSGTIPLSLTDLISVSSLLLGENQLSGTIPPQLNKLSNLVLLDLDNNRFSGRIPPELVDPTKLPQLRRLNLSFNQLSGTIPLTVTTMTSLRELVLNNNQLSGMIPPELGNLTGLELLRLGGNQLTGTIPPELGNLTSLTYLDLMNNQLTGTIPLSLTDLISVSSLFLGENQLSGTIPPQLNKLNNLVLLDLDNNQFSGRIPPELVDPTKLPQLRRLNLSFNQLSGTIPLSVTTMTSLEGLVLNNNQLSGPIPPELGNLTGLELLRLGGNLLTGPIPPELGNLTSLSYLDLMNNQQLVGPLPDTLAALTLSNFYFNNTTLCEPASLGSWLNNITNTTRTGLNCNDAAIGVSPGLSSTLVYTDGQGNPTKIFIPTDAVTEATLLRYTAVATPTEPLPPNLRFANHAFRLEAYQAGTLQAGFSFRQPVSASITYSQDDMAGLAENRLVLNYRNGAIWEDVATTCQPPSIYDRRLSSRQIALDICHLTEFGLFGPAESALSISKAGPIAANPEDDIIYTLTVSNTGQSMMNKLVITDRIPIGAAYVAGGTQAGNVVSWTMESLAGESADQVSFTVTPNLTTTETVALVNHDYRVSADGGITALGQRPWETVVVGLPIPDLHEPDDSCETAPIISPGFSGQSYLSSVEDEDYYKIYVSDPFQTLTVTLEHPTQDYDLALRYIDDCPNTLTDLGRAERSDPGPGGIETLTHLVGIDTGWYAIQVSGKDGAFSPTPYTLSVTVAETPSGSPSIWTLALTNRARLNEIYGQQVVTGLWSDLEALMAHEEVLGDLIDLSDLEGEGPDSVIADVAEAYAQWEANLTDPNQAITVSLTIRELIRTKLSAYPDLRYLLIIGGDHIVPFYRVEVYPYDEFAATPPRDCQGDVSSGWQQECGYVRDFLDPISQTNTVASALNDNWTLTDDFYADFWDDTPTGWPHTVYIPDRPIGRLVETPAEITGVIRGFLNNTDNPGSINLETASIAGWSFIADATVSTYEHLNTIDTITTTLLFSSTTITYPPSINWGAEDLRRAFIDDQPNLGILHTHSTHFFFTTPQSPTLLTAYEVMNNNASLSDTVITVLGCQSGLNIPDIPGSEIISDNLSIDLPQAFQKLGATYIGSTGWAYGSTNDCQGQAFGEQLMAGLAKELLSADDNQQEQNPLTIGQALARAKQAYWLDHYNCNEGGGLGRGRHIGPGGNFEDDGDASLQSKLCLHDHFDEKTLIGATLYGLPMLKITYTGSNRLASSPAAQVREIRTVLVNEQAIVTSTVITLSNFSPVPRVTPQGICYTLDGQSHNRDGEPVLPLYLTDLTNEALGLVRGVLFLGGDYRDEPIDPVIERATAILFNKAMPPEPTFEVSNWFPAAPHALNGLRILGDRRWDRKDRLVITIGQFNGNSLVKGMQRLYGTMAFEAYYALDETLDSKPPMIDNVFGRHQNNILTVTATITDPNGVLRAVVTFTDGPHTQGKGRWQSVDMLQVDENHWQAIIPVTNNVEYIVQAVDEHGNVSLDHNYGTYYWALNIDHTNDVRGHTFTATINPITYTVPITYVWQATDYPLITSVRSQLTNFQIFNWPLTGTKYITVSATITRGTVTGTFSLPITTTTPISTPTGWQEYCVPQRMEITGIGMGDSHTTINPQSLTLMQPDQINRLLAQIAGKHGTNTLPPESVTFITTAPQLLTLSEPGRDDIYGYTFVAYLQPTGQITAVVGPPGDSNQTPRGLILYAMRSTTETRTSVGRTLNEFAGSYLEVLHFPPLEKTTDLEVTAVVIDNDHDDRPMVVEATAGGVVASVTESGPTNGAGLNVVNLILPQVPADTDRVEIVLRAPGDEEDSSSRSDDDDDDPGDSLILVGVNVGYSCSASTGAIVRVNPSPATVPLGVTDLLTVTVTPGPAAVNAVQIHGQVDPAYLQLVDVRPVNTLPEELDPVSFDATTGEFRYGAGILGSVLTEPFAILVLEIRAIATTTRTPVEFLDDFPATNVSGPEGGVLAESLDGVVIVTDALTLQGVVDMQGRPDKPALPWAIPLTIWLTPAGSEILTYTLAATTDQNGAFSADLMGVPIGSYDVRIKGNHTLRNLAPNVPITTNTPVYFFGRLLEGDVVTETTFNQVFDPDVMVLTDSFNLCQGDLGFVGNANLNESEDQCVDVFDFGLLSGNYLREGDIVVTATTRLPSLAVRRSDNPKARVGFDLETAIADVNEIVTVTIHIDPQGQPVNGATIHLNFDPAKVEVSTLELTDHLPLILEEPVVDNQAGVIRFSAGLLGQIISEPFPLATLSLKVKAATPGPLMTFSDIFPATHLGGPESISVETKGITLRTSGESPKQDIYLPLIMAATETNENPLDTESENYKSTIYLPLVTK